jgi:glycosyltransferase involved in cell wall biosynthesis
VDVSLSLIIPAWNEELLLPALLDSVDIARHATDPDAGAIEVIVADNASTDKTRRSPPPVAAASSWSRSA